MNNILNEFVDHLHPLIMSTNDFSEGVQYRKRDAALKNRYIALNEVYKKYICLDLDIPNSAYIYCDRNLPPPTITTISPNSGRCHYLFKIKAPVSYTENSRRRPQRLFEVMDSSLTRAFSADPGFVGKFTKNPLHPGWRTITNPVSYDLEDFAEWIDVSPQKIKLTRTNASGRNCTLFDDLRFWAYAAVQHFQTFEAWSDAVEERGLMLNQQFTQPLAVKEALTVSRSVLSWVWRHRGRIDGLGPRRGILDLPAGMPLQEKQSEAAKYASQAKASKTLQALIDAATRMKADGKSITQPALVNESGLSKLTVKRYWQILSEKFNLYYIT